MIKLDQVVKAIHAAILSANDALVDKNLSLIENFFEGDVDGEELSSVLDDALSVIDGVLTDDISRPSRQNLSSTVSALEELKGLLNKEKALATPLDSKGLSSELKPKMTTIQYPHQTDDGVVMHDVKVPLITLVPLSMTQVSEVKFRTDLEIQVKDDDLIVSFPKHQSAKDSDVNGEPAPSAKPTASLEITLTPHHGTEGLKKLVEGYERVLRAQIPS